MSAIKKLVHNADGSVWVTSVCTGCYRYYQWLHNDAGLRGLCEPRILPQFACGECIGARVDFTGYGIDVADYVVLRERPYSEEAD